MADGYLLTDIEPKITRALLVERGVLIKNNYTATAAPTADDDELSGYEKGSEWIYGTTVYKCVSATAGEADWDTVTTT